MSVDYRSPIVIGGGALGGAVALGFAKAGLTPVVSRPKTARRAELEALKVRLYTDNAEAVAASEGPVFVAVKPWLVESVVRQLAPLLSGRVCCSLAARVSLEELESFAPDARWGRAIPNIAAAVGAGFVGIASTAWEPATMTAVTDMFKTEGTVAVVAEKDLNAVSTLSGSAIAFVFMAMEAFVQGGLSIGMPASDALAAAIATMEGAARLTHETGFHPAALKDAVCTPGGTTIAGLRALEAAGFKSALIEGILATYNAG